MGVQTKLLSCLSKTIPHACKSTGQAVPCSVHCHSPQALETWNLGSQWYSPFWYLHHSCLDLGLYFCSIVQAECVFCVSIVYFQATVMLCWWTNYDCAGTCLPLVLSTLPWWSLVKEIECWSHMLLWIYDWVEERVYGYSECARMKSHVCWFL